MARWGLCHWPCPKCFALAWRLGFRWYNRVKRVSTLSLGRSQSSVWLAAGLVVLTIAGAGCRQHQETLVSSPSLRESDQHLVAAVHQGKLDLVKAAIAEGADVNCRGTNGLTPLLQTVSAATAPFEPERRHCVAFLVEQGAEVNAMDSNRRTALMHATRAGDLETVRMLVDGGAAVKRRDRFHKTAILYAAEGGHRGILLYLGGALKVQTGAAW